MSDTTLSATHTHDTGINLLIQKRKQRLRGLKSLRPLPEHISTVSV